MNKTLSRKNLSIGFKFLKECRCFDKVAGPCPDCAPAAGRDPLPNYSINGISMISDVAPRRLIITDGVARLRTLLLATIGCKYLAISLVEPQPRACNARCTRNEAIAVSRQSCGSSEKRRETADVKPGPPGSISDPSGSMAREARSVSMRTCWNT
jgi:hypothetical protein